MKKVTAYNHGYEAGRYGANTENCNFAIFSKKENTEAWEKGNKDGKKDKQEEKS